MTLMYAYGAQSVKCAVCQFVTSVGVSALRHWRRGRLPLGYAGSTEQVLICTAACLGMHRCLWLRGYVVPPVCSSFIFCIPPVPVPLGMQHMGSSRVPLPMHQPAPAQQQPPAAAANGPRPQVHLEHSSSTLAPPIHPFLPPLIPRVPLILFLPTTLPAPSSPSSLALSHIIYLPLAGFYSGSEGTAGRAVWN